MLDNSTKCPTKEEFLKLIESFSKNGNDTSLKQSSVSENENEVDEGNSDSLQKQTVQNDSRSRMRKFEYTVVQSFQEDLANFVLKNEGSVSHIYVDLKGNLTIGIGYNLSAHLASSNYWARQFRQAGINLNREQISALNRLISSIPKTLLEERAKAGHEIRSKEKIAIISSLVNDYNRGSYGPPLFLNDKQAKSLFLVVEPRYENIIEKKLGKVFYSKMKNSRELIALTDMVYNCPGLLGNHLVQDIKLGNRAEAWYEIMYNSNNDGNAVKGIEERRIREAKMFGLYSKKPTQTEYEQVIQMFLRHEKKIEQIETKYSSLFKNGNSMEDFISPAIKYMISTHKEKRLFNLFGKENRLGLLMKILKDENLTMGKNNIVTPDSLYSMLHKMVGKYGLSCQYFLTNFKHFFKTFEVSNDGKYVLIGPLKKLPIEENFRGRNFWRPIKYREQTFFADPLVLDLNHNGDIDTVPIDKSGVYFNLDGEPLAEHTAWLKNGDGFLVADRNRDRNINNWKEMFGGANEEGFSQLKTFDTNKDGEISPLDEDFGILKVWQDKNDDGIVEDGELFTLKQLGITKISLNYKDSEKDVPGGKETQRGFFVQNGRKYLAADINFKIDPIITAYTGPVSMNLTLVRLPWLRGFGYVKDLEIAMSQNKVLKSLVENVVKNHSVLDNMDRILAVWTGLEAEKQRLGMSVKYPLTVAEKTWILGNFYAQRHLLSLAQDVWRTGKDNLIVNTTYLDKLYNALKERYIENFYYQAYLLDNLKGVIYNVNAGNVIIQDKNALLRSLKLYLTAPIEKEHVGVIDNIMLYRFMKKFGLLSSEVKKWKFSSPWKLLSGAISTGGNIDLFFGKGGKIVGSDGKDIIVSTTNKSKCIYSGEGDDYIEVEGGKNSIFSGKGNDSVHGGTGNDWIFGGEGDDVVNGDAGNDLIRGGKGDDSLHGGSGNDQIFGGDGSDDIEGGIGYDKLYGESGNDVINGDAGNDLIRGGKGDDNLRGDSGNDQIFGESGNDVLIGGKGDDYLSGGAGSDTYVYTRGDGNDILSDWVSLYNRKVDENVLELKGIRPDDLELLVKDAKNLLITDKVTGNVIEIKNWIEDQNHLSVQKISFSDGETYGVKDIAQNILEIDGSEASEHIYGLDASNTIYAGAGNDVVYGANFADEIHGGTGNDWIFGGEGDDVVNGDAGNDLIRGGKGDDSLRGGSGNDQIFGESGNDVLIGGKGDDYLSGGAGSDTYVYTRGDGNDILSDFGSGDDINLLKLNNIDHKEVEIGRIGSDLFFKIGKSTIDIKEQFRFAKGTIQKVETSDGYYLTSGDITRIIQELSSYASSAGLDCVNFEALDRDRNMMNIIINAWHHVG